MHKISKGVKEEERPRYLDDIDEVLLRVKSSNPFCMIRSPVNIKCVLVKLSIKTRQ